MNTIKLSFTKKVEASNFLSMLIYEGWSFDDEGKIRYLPLNDKNNFEWQSLSTSEWTKVLEIMKEKEKKGELIGITLIYKKAKRGGIFHIEDHKVIFSPTINRKVINQNSNLTDFNWYLKKLVSAFKKNQVEILEVETSQILI